MDEKKTKNELLAQLHLRIFCVGIRQMESTKRILFQRYSLKGIFRTNMDAELLEIVPEAKKKFNEIIEPKEELAKNNEHHLKMKLFFEAVSEVRCKICDEMQQHKKKQEEPKKL